MNEVLAIGAGDQSTQKEEEEKSQKANSQKVDDQNEGIRPSEGVEAKDV